MQLIKLLKVEVSGQGQGVSSGEQKSPPASLTGGGLRAVNQPSRKSVVQIGPALISLVSLISRLKELDQAVHQAATTADHVQSALVLMFFEDFIEIFFELGHGNLLWGIRACI